MAKNTPRGGRGQPARAAAKSKKSAEVSEVAAADAPGIGLDAGLGILTCLALLGALFLIDKIQGLNGDAIFFNR